MIAYLGINEKGEYQLCVSQTALNPVGTRLEKGKRMPGIIYDQAQNPEDAELAIKALHSMQRFLEGKEYGATSLQFGVDELPLLRKKRT